MPVTSIEICDGFDNNCDGTIDEGHPDLDGDGIADCVDPDVDGDGANAADDCSPDDPSVHPGAAEVCDGLDNDCNGLTDEGFPDSDADGIADCAETDADDDGVLDVDDLCPTIFGPQQIDSDSDGIGDACDPDRDGDGLDNDEDFCPDTYSVAQLDLDGDGLGDECDPDTDGDGSVDDYDCAPTDPTVGVGLPEACDNIDNDCDGETDESACDDGFDCTTDTCDDGLCTYVTNDAVCAPLNPSCAVGTCVPNAGCQITVLDGAPCSDGLLCTQGDICLDGECAPTEMVLCEDGDVCTLDWCEPGTGECVFEFMEDLPCSDGMACTHDDKCVTYGSSPGCSGGAPVCPDGNACIKYSCTASTGGECHYYTIMPWQCEYLGECGPEACDPDTGDCVLPATACDDGNPCTLDLCDVAEKSCSHGPACDDGDPCTVDSCDLETGTCVTTACEDSGPCAACVQDTSGDWSCDPGGNHGLPCDDGLACSSVGACVGEHCQATYSTILPLAGELGRDFGARELSVPKPLYWWAGPNADATLTVFELPSVVALERGVPIFASKSGVVSDVRTPSTALWLADCDAPSLWNGLTIDHPDGTQTIYHRVGILPDIDVGTSVTQGDTLGLADGSGCGVNPTVLVGFRDCTGNPQNILAMSYAGTVAGASSGLPGSAGVMDVQLINIPSTIGLNIGDTPADWDMPIPSSAPSGSLLHVRVKTFRGFSALALTLAVNGDDVDVSYFYSMVSSGSTSLNTNTVSVGLADSAEFQLTLSTAAPHLRLEVPETALATMLEAMSAQNQYLVDIHHYEDRLGRSLFDLAFAPGIEGTLKFFTDPMPVFSPGPKQGDTGIDKLSHSGWALLRPAGADDVITVAATTSASLVDQNRTLHDLTIRLIQGTPTLVAAVSDAPGAQWWAAGELTSSELVDLVAAQGALGRGLVALDVRPGPTEPLFSAAFGTSEQTGTLVVDALAEGLNQAHGEHTNNGKALLHLVGYRDAAGFLRHAAYWTD